MAVILHSIYGSRVGLSADGVLVVDGVAATYGTNLGNGSAASPSVSFASDSDTGVYRKGANNLGFAVNGALGMDLSTTALTLATGTDLVFSGTTGQCLIQFPDNLASGLVIGEGANAYLTFVSTNSSEAINVSQNLVMTAAAKGLVLKQGSNGKCGTFVCNGASAVTVSNTSIAITDTIVISLNAVGGTVGAIPAIKTITASTGFTVAGTASDTSTYNYAIISNAA